MSESNGNLTQAERMDLRSGAVVAYQTAHMLKEIVGTVDTINQTKGCVILCDGTWVGRDAFLRLLKAEAVPMSAAAEGSAPRGTEETNGHAAGSRGPADGEKPAAPKGTGTQQSKQDAAAKQPAARRARGQPRLCASKVCPDCGKPYQPTSNAQPRCVECRDARGSKPRPKRSTGAPDKRFRPKTDHALWLRAVEAVLDGMEAGMLRAEAVRQVAARPEFAALKMSSDTYGWWLVRFRKAGKVTRDFTGGKNRRGMPSAKVLDMQAALAALRSERADLVQRCDTLAEDLATARRVFAATDEARRTALAMAGEARADYEAMVRLHQSTDAGRQEALAQLASFKEAYGKLNDQYTSVCEELRQRKGPAAGGLPPPAADGRRRVDLGQMLRDGHELLRNLAVAVLLADIGRDAAADLRVYLDSLPATAQKEGAP